MKGLPNLNEMLTAVIVFVAIFFEIDGAPARFSQFQNETVRMLGGDYVDAYDFPYTCTVMLIQAPPYKDPHLGMCTIFSSKWAFTTMEVIRIYSPKDIESETMSALGTSATWKEFNSYVAADIKVTVGRDFESKDVGDPFKNNKYYQEKTIGNIYIVDSGDRGYARSEEGFTLTGYSIDHSIIRVWANPRQHVMQLWDLYTYRMNMAFLQLRDHFEWSGYVLPVPLTFVNPEDLKKRIDHFQYLNDRTDMFLRDNPCVVQGWKTRTRFKPEKHGQPTVDPGSVTEEPLQLVFKEVAWVTNYSCANSYCVHDSRSCLLWPLNGDLCFQSLSYGDVCTHDQGTALFCRFFYNGAIGFLKSSLNCGQKPSLPAVYTPVWMVMSFYLAVPGNTHLETRPSYYTHRDRVILLQDQP